MKREVFTLLAELLKTDADEIQKYYLSIDAKSKFTILVYQDCFINILPNLNDLSFDLMILKTDSQFYGNFLKLLKCIFQVLTLKQLFENSFIIKIFDYILNNLISSYRCSEVIFKNFYQCLSLIKNNTIFRFLKCYQQNSRL